jgi:ribosomal protein S18 acetylase RimI-like enzyme
MNHREEPAVVLEWDSHFFGLRIARANAGRLSEESVGGLIEWAESEGVRCLYLLADAQHAPTARLAVRHGFEPVDVRLSLGWEPPAGRPALEASANVRCWREDDVPALRELARASHRDSRFYFDGRFSSELCDRLYEVWIEKSCRGWADHVLVAERQGRVAGYLSCHREADGSSRIGLVAVARDARGSGLGTELVHEIQRCMLAEGRAPCRVVTQARNVAGQRLYQRCGFLTEQVGVWYHRWAPGGEAK